MLGWGGEGSAHFLVDYGQKKLRQMSPKVLSCLFPVPLKEVLGWGTTEGKSHGVRWGSWRVGRGQKEKG